MVKYAETEWVKKQLFQPEERILINPIDPVYKVLLEQAAYTDQEILSEIKKRLEERSDTDSAHADKKPEHRTTDDPKKEVLYQLFPLVSVAKKGSHSREASLVVNMVVSFVKERLWFALDNQEIASDILDTMKDIVTIQDMRTASITMPREDAFRLLGPNNLQYLVHWTCLSDYDLTQYYLVDGWSPLTKTQLIEVYGLLLTKALRTYIDQKREEYTTQGVQLPPLFSKVLQMVSSKIPAVSVTPVGAAEFDENAFPPCVREALHGASSGLRNYAITVLLTSFLSYARVYPSLTAFDQEKKPELSAEQIDILLDEVVPLIEEAGNRCDPPLFTDQPIEKANIFYHLGFGLTNDPSHTHFGSSTWYLPPSCKKIKQNAPALCKPDQFCLQGVYIIAEKKKLEQLIATTKGHGQPVLSAIQKTRTPRKIADISGVDIGEVKRILRNLQRNGILIQIRVKNPLVYYIRKIRRKKRKKN